MKRLSSLMRIVVCSAILVCMMGMTVFAAPAVPNDMKMITGNPGGFEDTKVGEWYDIYVDYVCEKGYMQADGPKTFNPNGNITRADFVAALGKMAGVDPAQFPGKAFSDCDESDWTTPYVNWAKANDIVKGTDAVSFRPQDPISRQDMSVMVENFSHAYKLNVLHRTTYPKFTDDADISNYAIRSVYYIQEIGIIVGYPDGSFKPQQKMTRAETAAVLSRLGWAISDGCVHDFVWEDIPGRATDTTKDQMAYCKTCRKVLCGRTIPLQ